MIPPGFAVVGSARCGTGYMSMLLRAAGVDCGHEEWWTLHLPRPRPGLAGDSSWLAVPDIEAGIWSGPVLHITRHPVAVVRSLLGIEFFRPAGRSGRTRWAAFALDHEPELADLPQLEASVEWWARWNQRCAAVADVTVDVGAPDLLAVAGRVIGRDLPTVTVPPTVNSRRRADADEAKVWRLLDGRAAQFGYAP